MAKWYGKIGFTVTEEIEPGMWVNNELVTREYFGDVISNQWIRQNSGEVNDNIKISNQINDYYPREVTIGFDDVKFPKLKITKNSVFEIKNNKINFYWNDEENSTIAEYDIIELSLLDSGINDVDFPLEQIKKLFEFSDVIKFEQKEDVKQAHKLTLQLDKNKYEVDSIQVLLMPYNIDISEEYKRDVKSYLGEN